MNFVHDAVVPGLNWDLIFTLYRTTFAIHCRTPYLRTKHWKNLIKVMQWLPFSYLSHHNCHIKLASPWQHWSCSSLTDNYMKLVRLFTLLLIEWLPASSEVWWIKWIECAQLVGVVYQCILFQQYNFPLAHF